MAYLFQPDYVRYACSCNSLKPISKIYFCRHCLKIRCGYCVCQEIDTYYCPNCLELLPTTEVRLKKNRCSWCFNCPCCFQTLSTRAGPAPLRPVTPATGEDVKQPKKVYYLFCAFCRWTSRDAGIPDQVVATCAWPEQENPHTTRINALIDYHKILASKERQQRERKKFHPKRSYMQFEKFGLPLAMARKRAGCQPIQQAKWQQSDQPQPSLASEDVEELPHEIFTECLDITKITTIEQRLNHPEIQAERINELRPQHKQFLVRSSQRCRACEHNVSKPEYCPHSIKFKIQLAAFYHIPEIRIVTCEPLQVGKTSELLLKFCNPTQYETKITLFSIDTPTTPTASITSEEVEELKRESIPPVECESPNLMPSAVRQASVIEDPKPVKIMPTADITLPQRSVVLPPRDDTAEYDETGDYHGFQDDPKLVVWRKGNRAVIRLHVTPHVPDDDKRTEPVIVGFVMQHSYVNTIATREYKAPHKLDLRVKLYLTLDKLGGQI